MTVGNEGIEIHLKLIVGHIFCRAEVTAHFKSVVQIALEQIRKRVPPEYAAVDMHQQLYPQVFLLYVGTLMAEYHLQLAGGIILDRQENIFPEIAYDHDIVHGVGLFEAYVLVLPEDLKRHSLKNGFLFLCGKIRVRQKIRLVRFV